MLRLNIDIGDGGIELDQIPNQIGFGNQMQYQLYSLDAIPSKIEGRGRYCRGACACRVKYRLEFGGFPIPNIVTIQTLEFEFAISNSEF
jgi:hypothetical protein